MGRVIRHGITPSTGGTVLRTSVLLSSLLFVIPTVAIATDERKDAPAAKDRSGEIEPLNKNALGSFHQGKLEDAIALWKQAEELAEKTVPDSSLRNDVLCNLGLAYFMSGSQYYPLVLSYLDRVIESDPNRAVVYMILGDMCFENYELACAISNYDLSLRLDPAGKYSERARKRVEALKAMFLDQSVRPASLKPIRRKYIVPVQVENDQPGFILYLTTNEESFLTRIDILRDGAQMIHETIIYGTSGQECNLPPEFAYLGSAVDFNGDGYNDVKIACSSGNDNGISYLYYLFHGGKSLFLPFTGGILPNQAPGLGPEEIRIYGRSDTGLQPKVEAIYKISGGRFVVAKPVTNEIGARSSHAGH